VVVGVEVRKNTHPHNHLYNNVVAYGGIRHYLHRWGLLPCEVPPFPLSLWRPQHFFWPSTHHLHTFLRKVGVKGAPTLLLFAPVWSHHLHTFLRASAR